MIESQTHVFLRCDGDNEIGLGHLSRCLKIANMLSHRSIQSTFLVKDTSVPHLNRLSKNQVVIAIGNPVSKLDDAMKTLEILRTHASPNCLIIDSYRHPVEWEKVLTDHGVFLVAVDDHLCEHEANLVINYQPGLSSAECPSRPNQIWLTGSKYFPQKNLPHTKRESSKKVLFFCGGTSAYSKQKTFFETTLRIFSKTKSQIDIIVTTPESREFIKQTVNQLNLEHPSQIHLIDHIQNLHEQLAHYQWIVGPASTTLYEGLIAGAIAISCALSAETTQQFESWMHAGHLLHLGNCTESKAEQIELVATLAIEKQHTLIHLRDLAPDPLGKADAEAFITTICQSWTHTKPSAQITITQIKDRRIRQCELPDIWKWLTARNHHAVRTISSSTNRIRRTDHIDWWLNTDRHKYVLEKAGEPAAYFWHQRCRDTDGDFYIGGWFPAMENSMSLIDCLEVMNFQFECAKNSGGKTAIWLASIEDKNKISLALSERFNFTEANQTNRERLQRLFPSIESSTKLLQLELVHES